jgi:selenocysteine-specific elongation factor
LSTRLPDGSLTAVLRLERPVAAAFGDRFVLRGPSPGVAAAGGRILDPLPPLGVSRRHASAATLAAAAAGALPSADALVALWGAVRADRLPPDAAPPTSARPLGPLVIESSVAADLESVAAETAAQSVTLSALRQALVRALRRVASVDAQDASRASEALIDELVAGGRLTRAGDRIGLAGRSEPLSPDVIAAMDRVEVALSVPAPPAFSEVVRAAGCPPEGVRALAAADRIVRLEPELAYARPMYARLASLALRMAAAGPVTPAAFRDATGTSRKYALAILEDLDRRGLLTRGPDGHVPGPRAPNA